MGGLGQPHPGTDGGGLSHHGLYPSQVGAVLTGSSDQLQF